MRKVFAFILPALFACAWAPAQTNTPATNAPPPPHVVDVPQPEQPSATTSPAGEETDAAKIAEYQKRYAEGNALQQQGKLTEARTVYDGILAEEPKAKGSLLQAGVISFELGDLEKADNYLERLHELVPDYPRASEMLIQINQALKRDVKVELLIRELEDLRMSGKVPELSKSPCFVREQIPHFDDVIVVTQFFDYTKDPDTVWMAEVNDTNSGQLKRRLLLNYDDAATQALRAKDPKYAQTQVFTWMEHIIKDGQVKEIDVYVQIFALPDYQKFRNAMLAILANPPKPIYTAPVEPSH